MTSLLAGKSLKDLRPYRFRSLIDPTEWAYAYFEDDTTCQMTIGSLGWASAQVFKDGSWVKA